MSKRKPTSMPTEAVHPLEPYQVRLAPWWIVVVAMVAALAFCALTIIAVALVLIL